MLQTSSPISNIAVTDILAYPLALFRRRFSTCPYPYLPRPARVPVPAPKGGPTFQRIVNRAIAVYYIL